ncbi:MAG: hypothetical protein H6741_20115 [Alphaproteobacteria bacterium]|nr:hypothetical protein [Alphaproteobacteria bacterium]
MKIPTMTASMSLPSPARTRSIGAPRLSEAGLQPAAGKTWIHYVHCTNEQDMRHMEILGSKKVYIGGSPGPDEPIPGTNCARVWRRADQVGETVKNAYELWRTTTVLANANNRNRDKHNALDNLYGDLNFG